MGLDDYRVDTFLSGYDETTSVDESGYDAHTWSLVLASLRAPPLRSHFVICNL
jgi:hypothetical protein